LDTKDNRFAAMLGAILEHADFMATEEVENFRRLSMQVNSQGEESLHPVERAHIEATCLSMLPISSQLDEPTQ
jgi:hypothetical protein